LCSTSPPALRNSGATAATASTPAARAAIIGIDPPPA
jgi:hypothetical protein